MVIGFGSLCNLALLFTPLAPFRGLFAAMGLVDVPFCVAEVDRPIEDAMVVV